MNERLTQEELAQVIFEIEKMRSRTEEELTREQVAEILEELDLSSDLLDEALRQVRRKQALKAQQKRNRLIILGTVASLLVVIAGSVFLLQQHNNAIAKVQAQADRITFESEKGRDFKIIERHNSSPVVYRVTLKDAPIGKSLDLSCNWINPNGEIVKQNRYQTRKITTSVWNTHCRYIIGSAAPVGNWQVQMFLNGRQLSKRDFAVK